MGKNWDSSSAQHWKELKMQKAVCAWAARGGTESRRGAHRFCGQHPELPSCFWQPQRVGPTPKAPACLISGGKSLWEKQFSAAVVIFKPEAWSKRSLKDECTYNYGVLKIQTEKYYFIPVSRCLKSFFMRTCHYYTSSAYLLLQANKSWNPKASRSEISNVCP